MVVKDRLAELQQARDNDPYQTYTPNDYNQTTANTNLSFEKHDLSITEDDDAFIDEIESIKTEIFTLEQSIVELKKLYNAIINPSLDTDEVELRHQAEQFKLDCDSLVSTINTHLKKMKMAMDELAANTIDDNTGKAIFTAEIKARRNHYNVAAIKFKAALQDYENAQQSHRDRIKNKLKRDMQIIDSHHHFDDDELEEMIDQGNFSVFDEGFHRAQENKEILSKLDQRAREMESLEKSMLELRNIFVQLQQLIEDQGYVINSVVDNVEATEAKAEHAVEELRQAAVYQSSARRKKIIIAICCVVIIIILIIVLCVTLIPKTN